MLKKPIKNHINLELSDFASSKLDIDFFINMPKVDQNKFIMLNYEEQDMKKIIKSSEVMIFYYQYEFIEWLYKLKQLRTDSLSLYRIYPQTYEETESDNNENKLENIEKGYVKYTDYIELLKYALNEQLNRVDKEANLMKVVNTINFKLNISGARIIFSNSTNSFVGIQNVVDNINFSCMLVKQPVSLKKKINLI